MVQRLSVSDNRASSQPPGVGLPPNPADLAQSKLAVSPYLPLRTLTCDSHEGVLALRGQVDTYYLKQMAQTLVRDVPGVEEVNNQVQVVRPEPRRYPSESWDQG